MHPSKPLKNKIYAFKNNPMKEKFKRFESASEQVLPEGLPIIARIDGNCFSGLTDEHFKKPFDEDFECLMNQAARGAMEYCSPSVLAYIQSDEISLLIPPSYKGSDGGKNRFLGGRTQKFSSLLAGHASARFSNRFNQEPAAFDARVFAIPEHEIINYFDHRQRDAWNNCLHSTAFYELAKKHNRNYAHNKLQRSGNPEKQELLFTEFNINPNDISTHRKRGRCLRRIEKEHDIKDWIGDEDRFNRLIEDGYITEGQTVERSHIELDTEIPIFRKNRRYIDYTWQEPIAGVA